MNVLAWFALISLAVGPLPQDKRSLTVSLCGGGEISIPISNGNDSGDKRDCHGKACHAGTCREKTKMRRAGLI